MHGGHLNLKTFVGDVVVCNEKTTRRASPSANVDVSTVYRCVLF
jgi:hypothetical protein